MRPVPLLLVTLLCACKSPAERTDSPGDTDTDTDTDPIATSGCAVDRWDAADFATVIDVGADYPAQTPSDVPWESLSPSTLVRIWGNGSPYADKWAIDVAGTESEPVVIIGVCDPLTGELPIIDGAGATTRLALDYWSETRGVLKIGGTSTNEAEAPAYVFVEDLVFRGGRSSNSFTDDGGSAQSYDDNAAAVFIEEGDHITLRGCTLTDSGNGLFVASASEEVLIASNSIYDNGNPGSIYEHNSYTEAHGITFEYNRYGPLCAGCEGNNLKDRSAGTVIRYNWIEGGNRQLDLVESEYADIIADPRYRQTHVYGNVLIEPDGAGNSQVAHYGGDGDPSNYRGGILYFVNNTVVSERPGNTTLVRLSTAGESAVIANSILYAAGDLALFSSEGTATLQNNWIVADWRTSFDGFNGTLTDAGSNTTGANPGFIDAAAQDYGLAAGSAAIDAAGANPAAGHPVDRQYVPHQQGEARPSNGPLDLGAFESL